MAQPAERTMVRMRDGVRLATDVYLPDGAAAAPAIVIRDCYDKTGPTTLLPAVAAHLTAHGFAVVAQDVRGKYGSEGEGTPWLPEPLDGFDTIDWIARQPWCDGAVGATGESYLGVTTWAAAASGHPALRAIAPRVTSQWIPPRWYGHDVLSTTGLSFVMRDWSQPARLPDDVAVDVAKRPFLDALPPALTRSRRILEQLIALDPAARAARLYPGGAPGARLRIPALHASGWWDHFAAEQIAEWRIARREAPAARHQLLEMAATNHRGYEFHGDGRSADDGLPAADAFRARLERRFGTALAFFDHHLRGRDGALALPPVRCQLVNGGWLEADTWPPREARPLELHLDDADRARDAVGSLATARPGRRSQGAWEHDPEAPVPGPSTGAASGPEPRPDERALHDRADVLAFDAAPLAEPLDLVGPVGAELSIGCSGPSTQVVAMLCDVAPDGAARVITEGIAQARVGDEPARVAVALRPTAYRLPAGHRLRLALASSRFPRYVVHPGTDESLWTATRLQRTEQTLHAGGAAPSRLTLSTLPSAAAPEAVRPR